MDLDPREAVKVKHDVSRNSFNWKYRTWLKTMRLCRLLATWLFQLWLAWIRRTKMLDIQGKFLINYFMTLFVMAKKFSKWTVPSKW